MVCLFIGIDDISKERKIAKIREENFRQREAGFDYEVIYADDVDKFLLNDSLNRLPIQAEKRIVVIKRIERLALVHRQALICFIKRPNPHTVLILDTAIPDLNDNAFILEISRYARVFNFKKERVANVFDLADAISRKNTPYALQILARLIAKGEKPYRLLGGLSWKWNKMQRMLSPQAFKRGIELFLEADTDIKLGRLKPNFALELLIVKLCDLGRA
jgi:DNA polymerase III delta subunit